MAAAGMMYMKTGFISFTPANTPIGSTTYGKSLSPDPSVPGGVDGGVRSTHRRLGTPGINGDSHNPAAFTPGNFDANGPCVTCHLNANGQPYRTSSHSWEIDGNAFNQVCVKCHDSEGSIILTADNFETVFIEEQSHVFQNALTLAKNILLKKYGIKYDGSKHPYFYDVAKDPSGATAVRDWTRGTNDQAFGQKVMGACFNVNLLIREPAAYVHARTFTRRLIYDSIDFLDDAVINLSVSATAVATDPATYGKGATANAPDTTESMKYLIGYNRTTGAWNTPERP
jgi:hypothetical protein